MYLTRSRYQVIYGISRGIKGGFNMKAIKDSIDYKVEGFPGRCVYQIDISKDYTDPINASIHFNFLDDKSTCLIDITKERAEALSEVFGLLANTLKELEAENDKA